MSAKVGGGKRTAGNYVEIPPDVLASAMDLDGERLLEAAQKIVGGLVENRPSIDKWKIHRVLKAARGEGALGRVHGGDVIADAIRSLVGNADAPSLALLKNYDAAHKANPIFADLLVKMSALVVKHAQKHKSDVHTALEESQEPNS